jgi:4-amino-4-deoxy-L-arabinose transferase-like glycosyltransferase
VNTHAEDLSPRAYRTWLLVIVVLAALLRGLFPAADPPWEATVGIVWHDEGAWTHNARNKALWGVWTQDAWNPMYIAPVFSGLEYLAFKAFGVGLRQARLMPEILGILSVLVMALGVARLGGRRAGAIAAALLATNYVYVMWNRTAMMEGPMVAFMCIAWYGAVRAESNARWAWLAAAGALLAFFTKAAAAFFVAAVGLEALLTLWVAGRDPQRARVAWITIVALAVCGAVALAAFVVPNWEEFWFYNVQISVLRKPAYTLKAFADRVTQFPVLHDVFTRMAFATAIGVTAALGVLARWRRVSSGERLLVLWVGLGALELILHDVGNERRFIFFIPTLTALTALVLGGQRTIRPEEAAFVSRRHALLTVPFVTFAAYVVMATFVRLAFLDEIRPVVRLSAALAVASTIAVYVSWPRLSRVLSTARFSPRAGMAVALLVTGGGVVQYAQWAAGRTYANYAASVELGRQLPEGTLVHGKLANGLALENRIRPVFVGRGFGNYADRKTRDDVRYILTYIAPSLGYESQARNPVIREVLDAYPDWRIIMTFDVRETATGRDRAALIDKSGKPSAKD